MNNEPNLFSVKSQDQIKTLKVRLSERVVRDFWIEIDGNRLDAVDLYETLREIQEDSDIIITNNKMVSVLKSLFVIENEGSQKWCIGATKGPNFDLFFEHLKKCLKEKQWSG